MKIESSYDCINDCPRFRTMGNPRYCPHCGANEVFPVDETVTTYEIPDEYYENNGESSNGRP